MIEDILIMISLIALGILSLIVILAYLAYVISETPSKIKCSKCGLKVEDKGYDHILCPRCNTKTREEQVW